MKKLTKQQRNEIYLNLAEFFENNQYADRSFICNELLKQINLLDEIYENPEHIIDKLKIETVEKYFPEFFLFKQEENWPYTHWFSRSDFNEPKDGRALTLFLCYEMTLSEND